MNDLPDIFTDNCKYPTLFNSKVPCLVYADDVVLISQSNGGLQESIIFFNNYCENWKLSINHLKTKVLIISKSKLKTIPIFQLNGDVLEIVNEHIYLGFIINSRGNFDSTMKMLTIKPKKQKSNV